MKPRIAIPIPTSTDLAYNQRSWPAYAEAISRSGGEPVQLDLTLSPAQIKQLAATCQGVVLPGSPVDVDPTRYPRSTALEPFTPTSATCRENRLQCYVPD